MEQIIFTSIVIGCFFCLMEIESRTQVLALEQNTSRVVPWQLIFFCLGGVLLIFSAGFRIGFIDTPAYRMMFDQIDISLAELTEFGWEYSKEYGFTFFMYALRLISKNSQILIFICSMLIISFNFYLIKKYTIDLSFSLLLFFFTEYLDSMNIMRQVLVIALSLLMIPWMRKGYFFYYLFGILLLSTIHVSVLLWLPFYFIFRKPVFHPTVIISSIVILLLLFFPYLTGIVTSTLFGENSNYHEYFQSTLYDYGVGIPRLMIQLAPGFLLLFYELRKRYKKQQQIETLLDYNIWANMLIISSLLTLLGIQTVILSRLSTYFSFSSIIIVPYIAKQLFEEKDYKILRWVIIGLYFIFFIFEVDKFNRGEYLSELNLIFWTE